MGKVIVMLSILILPLMQAAPDRPTSPKEPTEVKRLLDELPDCSVLRRGLARGEYGDGVEQPYMAKMKHQGVQRALLEVHTVLHGEQRDEIRVVRHLYFRHFDGPDSQISDAATLDAITRSGLSTDLDAQAHSEILRAPIIRGYSGGGKQASAFVEFLANPWLPHQKASLFPSVRSTRPLVTAVTSADAAGTRELLESHTFTQKELDRALFDAALSRYDNSAVIKLLLNAGAHVNARTSDYTTPLMNALAHPCNLRPLLDGGADLNARDKWGKSVLEMAREAREPTAIRLLEKARSPK